ncbi:D-alanine--D-alanine ligase family protein [Alienimonas californiensis]|uniref:D-alanine--D-alanine ligase n=1 Tax=Alienimonas californiensis TaxID=2527989 RepID=A0A517PAH5_9PLAN|nr:D-alanine--D-alanine ligase [Alienimonas californiensis]QDT16373.1 D-alanine--D-alanine ligase Ddl [Alienimonas californiensis]
MSAPDLTDAPTADSADAPTVDAPTVDVQTAIVARYAAALGLTPEELRPGGVTDDPLRIAVLCGGMGPEREISLASGAAVQAALKDRGHDAVRLELPQSHEDCVDALMTLDPVHGPFATGEKAGGAFDVAFVALHGAFGEDGRVQTVLERLGLPYTGSGIWSSVLSWRKRLAKARWAELGLRTAPWAELYRGGWDEDDDEPPEDCGNWPLPFVIKPDAGGSSVGVTRIDSLDELREAVAAAHAHDELAVAEQYIPGEEWSVPVLEGVALPPLRITPPGGADALFTYAAKYEDGGTRIEALPVGPEAGVAVTGDRAVAAAAAKLAVKAAEAVYAEGLCRVDLRVAPDGSPWLLELNAVPGFSAASLVPRSAAAAGVSAGLLYEQCCRLALR